MFSLKKNQKPVFSKLYRYYCTKLLSKIWLVLGYLLLFVVMVAIQGFSSRKYLEEKLFANASWQWNLVIFWAISLFQLVALWMMMTPLISYLVGRSLGWSELKNKQFFQIPKISREEDIKVVIFTPNVDRETIILAKFAAAFTYFMAINFFITLVFFILFLSLSTGLGVITALLFLLINGIVLALVNSLLIVPYLFYAQEVGSFLVYLLFSLFITLFSFLLFYLLKHSIIQYPVILYLISVPLYLLTGYFLFSLYREKFLKNDLD